LFIFSVSKEYEQSDYGLAEALVNCPELRERILKGLTGFEREYPSWFSSFILNLQRNFTDLTADGILMISGQRPAGSHHEKLRCVNAHSFVT
jgi:hypothetical protein